MMTRKKNSGIISRYFHVLRPDIHGTRHWAWKYLIPEIMVPTATLILAIWKGILLSNAEIIVSALGVLGGLLFAHAIFVFQLRMSYTTSLRERIKNGEMDGENTDLTRLIDELFDSVVYCSALALLITILTGLGSSMGLYSLLSSWQQRTISAVLLALIAHLAGCIYRVLRTTSSAYAELKKDRIV